jgi:hypothetical protein
MTEEKCYMHESAYNIGEVVFLKMAIDACPFIIVGILIRPSGIQYLITSENEINREAYEIELDREFTPSIYATDRDDD